MNQTKILRLGVSFVGNISSFIDQNFEEDDDGFQKVTAKNHGSSPI